MKRSSIGAVLLLATLTACDANDAENDGAAAGKADASAPSSATDELGELREYELSMEKIDRWLQAQTNLAQAANRMTPEERAALEAESEDDADNGSIEGIVASIERHPAAREALSDAGISPRDYAMTTMAMMQSSMAMSILAMRPNDNQDSLVREMDANPDNVRFMREHMEEITRKQEAAAAEMERLIPDEQ